MDKPFTYQSQALGDFARSPKGTVAVFFCDWDNLQTAQGRIVARFKNSSLDTKGSCKLKSYNATDADTGIGFKVIQATVVVPIPPRKQRGRPLGVKNKPKMKVPARKEGFRSIMDLRGPSFTLKTNS